MLVTPVANSIPTFEAGKSAGGSFEEALAFMRTRNPAGTDRFSSTLELGALLACSVIVPEEKVRMSRVLALTETIAGLTMSKLRMFGWGLTSSQTKLSLLEAPNDIFPYDARITHVDTSCFSTCITLAPVKVRVVEREGTPEGSTSNGISFLRTCCPILIETPGGTLKGIAPFGSVVFKIPLPRSTTYIATLKTKKESKDFTSAKV